MLAVGGKIEHGVAGYLGRRRRGEQVKAADRDFIFRNLRKLVLEVMERHKSLCSVLAPSELAFQPRQPVARSSTASRAASGVDGAASR